MKEHESVALTRALPAYGLEPGDVGAIVHIYENGVAYEVEFVAGDGATLALLTLDAGDVRPVSGREVLHVRELVG